MKEYVNEEEDMEECNQTGQWLDKQMSFYCKFLTVLMIKLNHEYVLALSVGPVTDWTKLKSQQDVKSL